MPDYVTALGGRDAPRRALARAVRTLYLATPLFALADLLPGLNMRTAFLDATPPLKWGYYVGATAAGVVTMEVAPAHGSCRPCRKQPQHRP